MPRLALHGQLSLLILALSGLVLPAHAADKVERRCGWFENPTPANATLTDRDGTWEIASQGGYQAEGDWPQFSDAQWVRTNGNYGYGCGCLSASANPETHRLNNLTKATARPLAACRNDKTLHEPENPLASTPPAAPTPAKDMKPYQAEGFSFNYPKAWKVSKNKECLSINQPKTQTNEEYTLNLCVQHGTLQQAADSMIFSQEDGVWMRSAGMDSPSPVDLIEGPGWKGMLTTQTCGVSDEETGFHAAGGTCLMAIVYNAKTQLLFDTVGYYQDFDTIGAIIRSVRFDEKP
ncbi:DUF4087 domain-containing protein [Pseudomonas gingeri]|uniref:DUF4087 domain-containing protein n=1 Tax=Pseudomonas gingeri TaxID=117681 RepID=UPI0015A15A66|nr:DUF4087 domain-containing protein [Pseudomonas gingeri]NWA26922.1 DUF4087 domain-containing protein [Pseudomonas gingeri]NWD70734.1 DUF4087 domain-containing protein [Pseudomonas gingeri]